MSEFPVFLRRRLTDACVLAAAYAAAFCVRMDFAEPVAGWRSAVCSFFVVAAVQFAALGLCGCLKAWRWRFTAWDLPRLGFAFVLAAAALLVLRAVIPDPRFAAFRAPYSVAVIANVFAFALMTAERFAYASRMQEKSRFAKLLNRRETPPADESVRNLLAGRTVMVTGAGGSIGSEIVRQVARAGAESVLMVERGENALYEIDREMRENGFGGTCVPLMTDINETEKVRRIFAERKPEVVLHAAAYKHVPMVEANPEEGWRNNAEASVRLGEIAKEHGVERFVLISTDKAVNPVSVMGKTKRAAEEGLLKLGYAAVRFGNVLGSSGSVVPLWEEQIARGGPVTVTDARMKRYFMTIPEAVGLVLVAAGMKGGRIYTLDMGEPVKMTDLAEEMIRRAGYRPYDDVKIVFTGIRPGEKLEEELGLTGDRVKRTGHARIFITEEDEA